MALSGGIKTEVEEGEERYSQSTKEIQSSNKDWKKNRKKEKAQVRIETEKYWTQVTKKGGN